MRQTIALGKGEVNMDNLIIRHSRAGGNLVNDDFFIFLLFFGQTFQVWAFWLN